MNTDFDEVRKFWDSVASDWQTHVGSDGDSNRRLNSDPVLWSFLGDVRGRRILDAGCGTGYLSMKLARSGAIVTGIDCSDRMIELARAAGPTLDFRVDSCSELSTVDDKEFDVVVANYLLMVTPDLDGTMIAFNRVLKLHGVAALVFAHPCFPSKCATVSAEGDTVSYEWNSPYFVEQKRADSPRKHFTTDFVWFHRPLSRYWKAFATAGFSVLEFEEPRITKDRYHLAPTKRTVKKCLACPYSVAFKLKKSGRISGISSV